MKALGAVWLLALSAASCGGPSGMSGERVADLEEGFVARVGTQVVSAAEVLRVAEAQAVPPPVALRFLVEDALAAEGGRARSLSQRADVQGRLRSALGLRVLDDVRASVDSAGPPTDDELAERSRERWTEVDVGEHVRVVHAVVRPPARVLPEDDAAGRELAGRVADAVRGAPAEGFTDAARAVPAEGRTLVVEHLPPFVADGRAVVAGRGPSFDPAFVAAAFALPVGAVSGPVRSPFGWHVIRVLERLPAHHATRAEREALFRDDIRQRRGRQAYEALLLERKKRAPVVIDPAAEALLGSSLP